MIHASDSDAATLHDVDVSVHKLSCRISCLMKISSKLYFPVVDNRNHNTVSGLSIMPWDSVIRVTCKFNIRMN